jgi:hypothetical protein
MGISGEDVGRAGMPDILPHSGAKRFLSSMLKKYQNGFQAA